RYVFSALGFAADAIEITIRDHPLRCEVRSHYLNIISSVISRHFEEAAFGWLLRERAVHAPQFSLRTLGLLEDRLRGHIDGVRIPGDAGWSLCLGELDPEDPGDIFTAGVIAFESGHPARTAPILEISCGSPVPARALASAFGWLPWETVRPHVELLARATPVFARWAAVATCAIHRQNLSALFDHLFRDEAVVRARVIRAAGELGRQDFCGTLKAALADSDEGCRFWAAFSLTLLGDETAHHVLCATAEAGGSLAERAAILAARAMPLPDALAWQRRLASGN